ncbi:hypothetical protein ORI20_27670 [Mycobacterium sp. CVI_P3]|uniref:Uncharacterized protein n=1 Tax=Mycobacterium pinniadriaticum TaxID=2994102 RepID=A0ABT3SLS8_9MYCO|nr:hypothetical protein [Mycobacterium pinniadriaticum]MCX2934052.1 hypothetical protein [Mycobacterium pinniadriaticum]MCX2940451.1 hypothetical protein [Mycobacterium pinniadriaticum]
MATRGDLRNAVLALQGQIPETMKVSRGSTNHVLTCAQFAQEEQAQQPVGAVRGDDALVLTLLSNIVYLESKIERAAGRQGVPDEGRIAILREFIL